MTAPSSSRRQILDRIRPATSVKGTGFSPYNQVPKNAGALAPEEGIADSRAYITHGQLPALTRIDLLTERLREYDAEVIECSPQTISTTIAAQLAATGKHSFVAPPGLPPEWLIPGFQWKIDNGLTYAEIETAEGVITAAFCAVADSGTIVLHHSPAEGRRVLTLLPDWHLCILRASQVVETFPEYFARCSQPPALATWISGPSATADIEMTRIKGVHGPRFLHVILVRDEP